MSNLKASFTIKELENITGISAHSIRIWEKRYNLFQPDRNATRQKFNLTEIRPGRNSS